MNSAKELTLKVIKVLKEASRRYYASLDPDGIPVVSERANWDFLEKIVEEFTHE